MNTKSCTGGGSLAGSAPVTASRPVSQAGQGKHNTSGPGASRAVPPIIHWRRSVRRILGLGISALVAGGGLVAFATSAYATDNIPVESVCNPGWYVNPDEGHLLPTQNEKGLLFGGPSLVHHATDFKLSEVPTDGTFAAVDVTGVPPLFKMETTGQYSTINKTADGKWWSSKIPAADPGGQSNPVSTPADLKGLWSGYTAGTKVFSFGVGYASDAGSQATVTSVTFAGTTYALDCPAKPADEHVSDEEWRCDGYFTRGGTVTYTWDGKGREWVKSQPTWGDWAKQRDLTEEEAAQLECGGKTPPSTPPATGTASPSTSASASPSSSPSAGADVSQSPDTNLGFPAGENEPTGGDLPTTGAKVTGFGLIGVGLILLGGLTVLMTLRRRREREIAAVEEQA